MRRFNIPRPELVKGRASRPPLRQAQGEARATVSRRRLLAAFALCLLAAPALAQAKATVRHGIAMHGDLKYPPDFQQFDYVKPDAPKGGAVKLADLGSFDSLNAFIVKGEKAAGLAQIHDTLMASSADEPFSMYGLLAESVEMPADRAWVAFTLRPAGRWHDGRPITVDDVIFSFETLREKGPPGFRLYYAGVDKVAATGPRTVRFTFKPGVNRELPLILGQFSVIPKHWWASRDIAKTTLEPPLGSGAYKIESVEPGRSIVYRRVADYWGKDLPVNRGKDNFDTIRYDYYRDATVALEAFKAGAFDFRVENSAKEWATGYDVPAVKDGLIVRREIAHRRVAGMQGFVFNQRRALFQDRRVRQALGFGLDFEWSNKNLFHGQYKRSRSFFDNSELAAIGLPQGAELALLEPHRAKLPPELFTTEFQPPVTDGSGRIRENLKKAADLLDAAGWTVDKDRRRVDKSGKPLEFEILLSSPQFERIALPLAKNLETLGVKARVRAVDTAQYQRRMDNFDFDVTVGVWGQSQSPGNEQLNYWGSAAADQEGSHNLAGIKDPVVDGLIEKIIAAPDRAGLVAATRALDRVLQWGHHLIPNWHLAHDRIAFWNRFGLPDKIPDQGFQFDALWIDPAKDAALAKRTGK